ncbi:acyl-acyl carrier protein thioesterase ATL2, chloroplastic-like [Sesamum indicum]|uniref:Acyl-acyl carrier protein thioesterase ATL2, chloroplastic-like n=1 Tax=Sesamum indicum TaxID=4182 RepID=A0A6I9T7Z9_SESIN|nr:acyl-acyl carrier protein thioesterase ATL2, chloroplastic-like [Sesamum indicum]
MSASLSFACLPNTIPTSPSLSNPNNPQPKSIAISRPRLHVNRAQLSTVIHPVQESKADRWLHEIELSVRDYEIDQFGVVNNAVYANYCQHARHEMMRECSSADPNVISGSGYSLATTELSFKFIAALRGGDRFLVKNRIPGWSKTRLFIVQSIVKLPNKEPILEARATTVWLDKNYRPMRIPPEMLAEISELCYPRSN